MTNTRYIALLSFTALLSVSTATQPVQAQQLIERLTDPIIGAIPSAPDDAQLSHDEVSIGQLMKLVELSRVIGGGITQLFNTIVTQTAALEKMRDAQNGVKTIPLHNEPEMVEERVGGAGLNEMAKTALDGLPLEPQSISEALAKFQQDFGLEKAFALKNDGSPSKFFLANGAAQGAIASSTAEVSYKRANSSMDRIPSYINAIENSPDLKTSVDINTRVMIELTQQVNESLRTQSALASMAGTYFMIIGGEAGKQSPFKGLEEYNR